MNRNWIRFYRYRILAFVLFMILVSSISLNSRVFGEETFLENRRLVQIINHWPNKTALQVEEHITKPWEQILRSIYGYKQIESISEAGISTIYLELAKGVTVQEVIQSIRNEYLLQRLRFPEDSLFPRIQEAKSEDNYIVILQKIKIGPDKNRKQLEQRIRNITGVVSFSHHSDREKEVVLQVQPAWIQSPEIPSAAKIFASVRNYFFGVNIDHFHGLLFQKDFPSKPKDWSDLGIPSLFGEGLLVSSIGKVTLQERDVRHGTRINGLSSETIILKAENSTSLYHISKELNSILPEFDDWAILYTSHQDFLDDLWRFFILFISLDLILILSAISFGKPGKGIIGDLLSFYASLLILFGICNFSSYPIGRSVLFLMLVWKYSLAVFPMRRIGRWTLRIIYCSSLLWLFIIFNWIPFSFGIISLIHLYFILSISLLKILFQSFFSYSIPIIDLRFLHLIAVFSHKTVTHPGKSRKLFGWIVVVVCFFVTVLFSFISSLDQYILHPFRGTIQTGRLEFPTSVPEQETIRITKQVENQILNQKITDLLVVKQNSSTADFYFRLNELGVKKGLHDLPTESGYFHVLSDSEKNTDRTLHFGNANTETLEKSILGLVPWLRTKGGVTEVLLCFQPSTIGLEFNSNAMFQNLVGYELDEFIRERSLGLQSVIVGKMLIENKLTDVRFEVKQDKEMDRYLNRPTKMASGIPVFNKSFVKYYNIRTPGRIYHKNGDTRLEILVRGKNIQWDELQSKIQEFLNKDVVKLSEILPPKDITIKYRPFFLVLLIAIFLYRKNHKARWCIQCFCFLFIWKLQISLLGEDYLLFGTVATLLVFLILWVPHLSFDFNTKFPLLFLLFLSYLLPGDGGRFFWEGLVLMFSFLLIQSNMFQKWENFKTKHYF